MQIFVNVTSNVLIRHPELSDCIATGFPNLLGLKNRPPFCQARQGWFKGGIGKSVSRGFGTVKKVDNNLTKAIK